MDLLKVWSVSGGLPLRERAKQRQAYGHQELRRWREFLGIPCNLEPAHHPVADRRACELGSFLLGAVRLTEELLPESKPARKKDLERVRAARWAIGPDTELYVDANGAFDHEDALTWADRYRREWGVTWHEEPVSSADFACTACRSGRWRTSYRCCSRTPPTRVIPKGG